MKSKAAMLAEVGKALGGKPSGKKAPKRKQARKAPKPPKRNSSAPEASRGTKTKDTFTLTPECLARIRAAAYWTPGETKSSLVERAVLREIERMEKSRGEAFKRLPGGAKVDTGRPLKK